MREKIKKESEIKVQKACQRETGSVDLKNPEFKIPAIPEARKSKLSKRTPFLS